MLEKFHWTSPGGVEIVIPHANHIKAGVLRKNRNAEPVDFMFLLVESVADEAMLARMDELTIEEINDLFAAWQEAGASLGESGGSST